MSVEAWFWMGVGAVTGLIALFVYFWYDIKDPSGIYRNKALQLDPTNEEIRLLILEPGDWEDDIRCQLKKEGLGKRPKFTALSYAWTEAYPIAQQENKLRRFLHRRGYKTLLRYIRLYFGDSRKRQIWVNGRKHQVGINLELALRHMREKRVGGKSKKLWADAICINQDDNDDRTKQVQSMRRVYKSAEKVEIWLGAERDVRGLDDDAQHCDRKNPLKPSIQKDYRGDDVIWQPVETEPDDEVDPLPAFQFANLVSALNNTRDSIDKPTKPYPWTTGVTDSKAMVESDTGSTSDTEVGDSSREDVPSGPEVTDRRRVVVCIDRWYDYNNKPKMLRAAIDPDYTMEFFCMINLLQGKAFEKCKVKSQGSNPLDERIPFLKTAAARGPVLEVFKEFMTRLWWTRLWVVQETVIASNVVIRYGRFVIPWENLVKAANNFEHHRGISCCAADFAALPNADIERLEHFAETVGSLNTWRMSWIKDAEEAEPKIKLLRLLWTFRARSTSDFRDKVYALLPLVNYWGKGQKGHTQITTNYTWQVDGLYKNIVRNIISMEDSLTVLIGNTMKTDLLKRKLPSWAPDWSQSPTAGENARLERVIHDLYRASGNRQLGHHLIHGNNEFLQLKGLEHDVVTQVSRCMPKDNDAKSYISTQRTFKAWQTLAYSDAEPKKPYVDRHYGREVAYWKTICMDSRYVGKEGDDDNLEINKQDYHRADPDYGNNFNNSWNGKSRSRNPTFVPSQDSLPDDPDPRYTTFRRRSSPQYDEAASVNKAVETATISRRFFVTKKGYMGLGPDHMKEGDLVYILIGAPVPFLLRYGGKRKVPQEDLKDCHTLIGDCFVQGIMDGEATKTRGGDGLEVDAVPKDVFLV